MLMLEQESSWSARGVGDPGTPLAPTTSHRVGDELEQLRLSTVCLEKTMGSPLVELRRLLEMPFMQSELPVYPTAAAPPEPSGEVPLGDELESDGAVEEGIPPGGGFDAGEEVREFLEGASLGHLAPKLVEDFGAFTVSDLAHVTDEDLDRFGAREVEKRRFAEALDLAEGNNMNEFFAEIEAELREQQQEQEEEEVLQLLQDEEEVSGDKRQELGEAVEMIDAEELRKLEKEDKEVVAAEEPTRAVADDYEELIMSPRLEELGESAARAEMRATEAVQIANARSEQLTADVAKVRAELAQMREFTAKAVQEAVTAAVRAATSPVPQPPARLQFVASDFDDDDEDDDEQESEEESEAAAVSPSSETSDEVDEKQVASPTLAGKITMQGGNLRDEAGHKVRAVGWDSSSSSSSNDGDDDHDKDYAGGTEKLKPKTTTKEVASPRYLEGKVRLEAGHIESGGDYVAPTMRDEAVRANHARLRFTRQNSTSFIDP